MSVFGECANRGSRDVTRVNGRRWDVEVRPAHDVSGPNLRCPPEQCVRSEHPWPQESPFEAARLDALFDIFPQGASGIRLLKQRMWGFEGSREEHNPPGLFRDPLQSRIYRRPGCRPNQKDGIDPVETAVECFGNREIARDYLDGGRKNRSSRIAYEGAHPVSGANQLRNNLAAYRAGSADNENMSQAGYPAAARRAVRLELSLAARTARTPITIPEIRPINGPTNSITSRGAIDIELIMAASWPCVAIY